MKFWDRWMSKEPAEIFERAAEDGFITQVEGYSDMPYYFADLETAQTPLYCLSIRSAQWSTIT